jgi:hypothetical protein
MPSSKATKDKSRCVRLGIESVGIETCPITRHGPDVSKVPSGPVLTGAGPKLNPKSRI